MSDNTITPDTFRRASGLWATGVSIVTTVDGAGKPYGLTMNAVTSLSLNPPMFIVCVDNNSDTLAPMRDSKVFCINVLASTQQDLSNRFAKKGDEKFNGVAHAAGATGAPLLAGALLSIECAVTRIVPGGDHQIMLGEVQRIVTSDDAAGEPLLYFGGRYAALTKAG
ncbi:MAG: flavin reductase family protein [Proteobacteria bacterium]|nr:flavin reductase family protein [Pseudomonadota bacterium]